VANENYSAEPEKPQGVASSAKMNSSPQADQATKHTLHPTTVSSSTSLGELFYSRVFALAATLVLGILLYRIVAPFIGPLVWSLFLAFLLHPVHVRLARKLRGRDNLSATLLTLAAFLLLVGPLAALSATFVSQAIDLVQWAQGTLADQTQHRFRSIGDLPIVGPILEWARSTFNIRTSQIQGWFAEATAQLPKILANLGGQIFLGALNTVFAFVVMIFMLFFFLRDGAKLVALLRDLIPMNAARREDLAGHVAAVTRAVVFGTGITALVQGTLVGLAFAITGLSSPLVFGVLAALLALLPVGGTALVWIPALLYLGAQQSYGMAVVMLIFGILSSSVDNVLRPLLISGRADVGTLTVFVGVLGGTSAFGPIGLFLGPVVLALIIALAQFARDVRRSAN
jgi:predicted PurR-regulated permease PerM